MSDWREFYDKRRNRAAFTDKVMEAESRLKLEGEGDGGDHWTFGRYSFDIADQEMRGARELVAAYAIYVKRATVAGDDVDEFERPTADGWA